MENSGNLQADARRVAHTIRETERICKPAKRTCQREKTRKDWKESGRPFPDSWRLLDQDQGQASHQVGKRRSCGKEVAVQAKAAKTVVQAFPVAAWKASV